MKVLAIEVNVDTDSVLDISWELFARFFTK